MSKVKCFDIASMVVEEATRQFAPIWKLDEKKYDILRGYCEAIDKLSDEFNGIAINVQVDEIKMTVSITLTIDEIIIQNPSEHIFYQLVLRSELVGFSVSEEGDLDLTYVFPSLWEKV